MIDPTLILGGLKLAAGLFGGGKKEPNTADNIDLQALGARRAAEKYGFNPLTLLGVGQSVSGSGGPPPLASSQILSSGLDDLGDVLTGEKAKRNAANTLAMQLKKLQLDRASAPILAVDSIGAGRSTLGRQGATFAQSSGRTVKPLTMGAPVIPQDEHVLTSYTTSSGNVVAVPLGPDFGEVVTGFGIEGAGLAMNMGKKLDQWDKRMKNGQVPWSGPSVATRKSPALAFPKNASKEQPKGWDTWHHDRQRAYLTRFGL